MGDEEILAGLDRRDEEALAMLQRAYGPYCEKIARGILTSREDCEECLNDVWAQAWQALPGNHPRQLDLYLAAVTRNTALSRCRYLAAEKRSGRTAVLEELAECISGAASAEDEVLRRDLGAAINGFLKTLPGRERDVFLRRYYFADPVADIARRYRLREDHIYVLLSRTRKKLMKHLRKEGYLE